MRTANRKSYQLVIAADSEDEREFYRRLLEERRRRDYECFEAASRAEAAALIEKESPDCLLVGEALVADGMAELINSLTGHGMPPVIVIASGGDSERCRHLELHVPDQLVVDTLSKDSMTAELLEYAVDNAVRRGAMQRTIREQAQQLEWLYGMERERRAELEQRVQERDTFLAMLSHELRNPLGAISMAAELLQQDDDPQQQSIGLRVIVRQSQHMSRMLDELLDVARITQGKIELKKQPVAVATLVEQAIQSTRVLAHNAQHRLTVAPIDPNWIVHGDVTRLEQVLVNLLKNAIKFTPPGGHIEVATRLDGADLEISVRDNGSGVPTGMQAAIFEPFVQTERSADRSQGGLGLGLAVVRKLVELHSGSVGVQSAGAGEGSEFTIRLPAARRLDGSADISASPHGPHRDVLVIEDSPDARDVMSRLLRLLGHRVNVAEDGQRGFEALQKSHYDVALVDIGLPVMDGYQVARQYRALPDSRPVRLIAVTGYGNPEDRRQALEAGFDEHVVKPVNMARLAELINSPAEAL